MSKTVSETSLEIWAAIHKATEILDDEKARRMRRDGGNQRTDAIMNASATLKDHQHEMSAAPQMLAALKAILPYLPYMPPADCRVTEQLKHDPEYQAVTAARAAIRAAEGKG